MDSGARKEGGGSGMSVNEKAQARYYWACRLIRALDQHRLLRRMERATFIDSYDVREAYYFYGRISEH